MGQKVHPSGFRIGITKDWVSKWYANKKNYSNFVMEDIIIRRELDKLGIDAAISHVEIIRKGGEVGGEVKVIIYSARPGMIIGKKGAEISKLQNKLMCAINNSDMKIGIEVKEVKRPETNAQL
ncbi:MAG: 30S ribosomal protein S3, partial [Caldisericota bacterium]|nr:30S ribosomal protein S3 [Caldisericota bacterium]